MAMCINYIVCQSASKMHLLINIWLPPPPPAPSTCYEHRNPPVVSHLSKSSPNSVGNRRIYVNDRRAMYTSAFLHIR